MSQPPLHRCIFCNSNFDGPGPLQDHCSSKSHRKAESVYKRAGSIMLPPPREGYLNNQCPLCLIQVPANARARHDKEKKHKRLLLVLTRARKSRPAPNTSGSRPQNANNAHTGVRAQQGPANASSANDLGNHLPRPHQNGGSSNNQVLNGVAITYPGGLDFNLIDPLYLATPEGEARYFSVRSLQSNPQVAILSVKVVHLSGAPETFTADVTLGALPQKGKEAWVRVRFKPKEQKGLHEARIDLTFVNFMTNMSFLVSRNARAEVGSGADYQLLRPQVPYKPPTRKARAASGQVEPGVPVPSHQKLHWVSKLKEYPIPPALYDAVTMGNLDARIARVKNSFLPSPKKFKPSTYGRYWETLLWIEEIQETVDLQGYNMYGVQFEGQRGVFHQLAVPGLAEKRPSVIVGDRFLVRPVNSNGTWYEGHVHDVLLDVVSLHFSPKFHWIRGTKYDVEFQLNRIPLQRMHQALASPFAEERVLFPTMAHIAKACAPTGQQIRSITPINRDVRGNAAQLLAVASIVLQPPGSLPFVIYGPPGTGKTVTLVESILQVLQRDPTSRILACAPSNSAADLIVARLKSLDPVHMYRLNALRRPVHDLRSKPDVKRFCQPMDERWFRIPPLATLLKYRIIVTTCISASMLHCLGMQRGHFTHLFVDEAGHAMEPEIMASVKTLAGRNTNIILSGDPKQLSPIVRSAVARSLGLTQSYLERLMNLEAYDEKARHGISVVKLVQNYRSDPAILRFPNEQFYSGDLEVHADQVVTSSHHRSSVLVKQGFPIVFEGVVGKDEREASSPSYFNRMEASLCSSYTQRLLNDKRCKITPDDIGIITPYHAQALKIRQLIQRFAPTVKVGSVEEFQGQERRVIIVSTVRSSTDYLHFDLKHMLGFVANPKRLNVAITRARSLLIVIGNPHVLSLDPIWRKFLNYIHLSGGWRGQPIDWDPREPVREGGYDLQRRTKAEQDLEAIIRRSEAIELGEDEEVNLDLAWRDLQV